MPSSLQGNLECKSNCKYVLHLEEKLQKTEIHYSNKCREFDSLKYKNSELRAKNTALREEFNMLLAKLRKEEKNAEKAAEFKSRAEELERRNRELEAELSKCNKEAGNVEDLKKELDEANSKIRKYEVRLNMDSRNSSKPTSTNAPERKVHV